MLEHEVFCAVFVDAQHRPIAIKTLFRGTGEQTSTNPREVVKEVLAVNAGAVIFAHNHPSGSAEPSVGDKQLTRTGHFCEPTVLITSTHSIHQ